MRVNDWYFRGWEKQKDGNGKTVLVYTGEYYSFPNGLRPVRKQCAVLTAALTVIYLLIAFFPSAGGMQQWAAIPQLLELIPLLYLCIATVSLLLIKNEKFTFREYHGSWLRVRWTSWLSLILTTAMAVLEIVYMCLLEEISPIHEMLFFLGALVCAVLSWMLTRLVKNNPCSVTGTTDEQKE